MTLSLLMLVLLYGWVFFLLGSGIDGLLERIVVTPMLFWLVTVVSQWMRLHATSPIAAHA
jgi:hypothetical protein